jgi:hypothetical protein
VYLVERRQVSEHWQIYLLVPIGLWTGRLARLAASLLQSATLQRFDPIRHVGEHDYVVFDVMKSDPDGVARLYTTISRPGEVLCATLPSDVVQALVHQAGLTNTSITLASVKSQFKDYSEENGVHAATLLTAYIRDAHISNGLSRTVMYPNFCSVNSAPLYADIDTVANGDEPVMVAFMQPLTSSTVTSPVANRNMEGLAVGSRVRAAQKHAESIRRDAMLKGLHDTHLFKCIDEYTTLVVEDIGTGEPLTPEEVLDDKKLTPTKLQSLINGASTLMATRDPQSFIKAETYSDEKPPRLITTFDDHNKVSYACYARALAARLKLLPFNACGKTPAQTAQMVADFCSVPDLGPGTSITVSMTDYSKLDGHIIAVARLMEQNLMTKFFGHRHFLRLNAYWQAHFCQRVFTRNGFAYFSRFARGSGSFTTSDFNTLLNAFIEYYHYRSIKLSGTYMSPRDAFSRIGPKCGDDGLTRSAVADRYRDCAAHMGQHLVLLPAHRPGELPQSSNEVVAFLARWYSPDVYFGDTSSITHPSRAIDKLHLTPRKFRDLHPGVKLTEKCISIYASDSQTPVLGPLVELVRSKLSYVPGEDFLRPETDRYGMRTYGTCHELSVQYPQETAGPNGTWMDHYFDLSYDGKFDRKAFDTWLEKLYVMQPEEALNAIMNSPGFTEPVLRTAVQFSNNDDVACAPLPMELATTPAEVHKERAECVDELTELINRFETLTGRRIQHDAAPKRAAEQTHGGGRKEKVCFDYLNRKDCKHDPCRFKHVQGDEAPACRFGKACKRTGCRYSHKFDSTKGYPGEGPCRVLPRGIHFALNFLLLIFVLTLAHKPNTESMALVPYVAAEAAEGGAVVPAMSRALAAISRNPAAAMSALQIATSLVQPVDVVRGAARGVRSVVRSLRGKRSRAGRRAAPQAAQGIVALAPIPASRPIVFRPQPPRLRSSGPSGNIRIRHQELVARISGEVSFTMREYLLNPSNVLLFPWLSALSRRFMNFKFHSVSLTFIPKCPSIATGSVYMAANYNVNEAIPVDSRAMMSQYRPIDSTIWNRSTFRASTAKMNTQKSFFVVPTPTTADNLVYPARLLVATEDLTGVASGAYGDLIITYDIELMTPVGSSDGSNIATVMGTTGISVDFPYGTNPEVTGDVIYSVEDTGLGGDKAFITFPRAGEYSVTTEMTGTNFTVPTPPATSPRTEMILLPAPPALQTGAGTIIANYGATSHVFAHTRQSVIVTGTNFKVQCTFVNADAPGVTFTLTATSAVWLGVAHQPTMFQMPIRSTATKGVVMPHVRQIMADQAYIERARERDKFNELMTRDAWQRDVYSIHEEGGDHDDDDCVVVERRGR